MSDLVAKLGRSHAQRLASIVGGTRLSIPRHAGKPPTGGRDGFARLIGLVGPELATLLVFHFSDARIYVPLGERGRRIDPKAVQRLKRLSAAQIARKLGCSERTVHKHRNPTRSGFNTKPDKNERGGRSR